MFAGSQFFSCGLSDTSMEEVTFLLYYRRGIFASIISTKKSLEMYIVKPIFPGSFHFKSFLVLIMFIYFFTHTADTYRKAL